MDETEILTDTKFVKLDGSLKTNFLDETKISQTQMDGDGEGTSSETQEPSEAVNKLEHSANVVDLFNLSDAFEDKNPGTPDDQSDHESDPIENENLRTDLSVQLPALSPISCSSKTRSGRSVKIRQSIQTQNDSNDESVDESEYVPSDKTDEDSESISEEEEPKKKDYTVPKKVNEDTGNVQRNLSMNQIVPYSSEGGKWYQKSNFCYYCKSMQSRIDIHVVAAHLDVPEVLQASVMKVRSIERRRALGAIRLKGNDLFNSSTVFNPEGKIIASRRLRVSKNNSPLITKTAEKKNVPIKMVCPYCDIYVAYKNLQNHIRKAHLISHFSNTRNMLALSKKKMGLCHPRASELVREHILPKLKMDNTGCVARMDLMIILYANKFVIRYMNIDQQSYVRGHMRLLSKLLIAITSVNSKIKDLSEAFRPVYWPTVLESIKVVSEYDAKTNRFSVIYNAETIPILIRKCIKILKHEFTIKEDKERLEHLIGFESVFEDDVECQIAYTANLSRKECIRHGEEKKLPETEDIYTFESYLSYKRNISMEHFESGKNQYSHYLNIMQTTAVRIFIYNRRRPGEVGKTLLKDYSHAKKADPNSEFFKCLSKAEQEQRLKYTRIDIQGKKADGKGSLYITDQDIKALDLLLRYRQVFNISASNIYLFALPNDSTEVDKHIKISEVLPKLSK